VVKADSTGSSVVSGDWRRFVQIERPGNGLLFERVGFGDLVVVLE
jgi:hypothetical protein